MGVVWARMVAVLASRMMEDFQNGVLKVNVDAAHYKKDNNMAGCISGNIDSKARLNSGKYKDREPPPPNRKYHTRLRKPDVRATTGPADCNHDVFDVTLT
ncbi:Uncharacterized protein TCM_041399 [Theobroma cacao]|uniref:Uncharacterized protein n=1 Tax=Theobroma cacao TaxID=3641 RepID=A0A061GZQ1_THECC|nr:Uncharacterized protein TCM_041399 [Theobroma cacao]